MRISVLLIVMGTLSGCAPPQAVKSSTTAVTSAQIAQTPAGKTGTFVNAGTKAAFEAAVQATGQEMNTGGRFEFTDRRQRETVNDRFAAMQALFDKYGSVDKMPDAAKLELFSDQEKINGILTHTDANRLVCRTELPVGSHLPVKHCRTYGEIRRSERDTVNDLRRMQGPARNTMPGAAPGSIH
ncbi:MAG TPA: hypothetical protein VJL61_11105 [Rhodanobacteraceae bacterium]|nr:hypothetical protein [Rhodanobacteraceae bacterium]